MSEDDSQNDSQIEIPPSFLALFMEPGRSKPTATRFFIAQRYELCEDMAQLLTQTAQEMLHRLGIAERDVLQHCYQGLCGDNRWSTRKKPAGWCGDWRSVGVAA